MKRHWKKVVAIGVGVAAVATVALTHQSSRGPADIYPPILGALNTSVTQATIQKTICVSGWTATIRPPSSFNSALKQKQMLKYGLTGAPKDYEEDHFISLELGGNPTDPNNLWPEPYTASIPTGGAKTKDSVENYLKKEICNGTITLAEAQRQITTDWYQVYKSMQKVAPSFGSVDANDFDDL